MIGAGVDLMAETQVEVIVATALAAVLQVMLGFKDDTLKEQKFTTDIGPVSGIIEKDGDVDYEAHRRNIGKWNKECLAGYLVLGSNSETAFLTEEEKLKLSMKKQLL